MIPVKVINLSQNELPKYETKCAAGADVRADFSRITPDKLPKMYGDIEILFKGEGHSKTMVRLDPNSRILIPTGLFVSIPSGYEIQIRPRSGFALKYCLTFPNSPATIDEDYRGEIGIILQNAGFETVWIEDGERLGQFVLNKVEQIKWQVVETLDETDRGEGGFSSTGTK